jgi:hypothetical protein
MDDAKRLKRWTVRGRRVVVVILLIGLLLLGARAASDAWMGRRLTDVVVRLERDYGPLRWDPVRKIDAWKKWPRRTDPGNRARLLDAAAASVTASAEKVDRALLDVGVPIPRGEMARLIAQENRQAVQLAIRAAGLAHSNWEVSYVGEVSNVPNLLDHHLLSRAIVATAEDATDAGRYDDAMSALAAGFAQAAAMGTEPARVMSVNAFGALSDYVNALKDVLERGDPTATALTGLAAAVDENIAGNPAREALLGELKHARWQWPLVERGWLWGRTTLDYQAPTPPSVGMRAISWLGRPIIRSLAVRDLENRARVVDAAGVPRTRRAKDIAVAGAPPQAERLSTVQLGAGLIEAGDRSAAQLGLTASAIALRRFRLDHGAYPSTLAELVPVYLKAMPIDPFSERPFEYRREGSGFALEARIPQQPLPSGARRIPGYRDPRVWKLTR